MANGTAVVSQNKDVRKSINDIENIANLRFVFFAIALNRLIKHYHCSVQFSAA